MSYHEEDNNAGKILLAALAGAGAGIIAGMLLAPDKGSTTRESWKGVASKYSGQLGEQATKLGSDLEAKFKEYAGKLEDLGLTGAGGSLKLKGNWDELKGKLKQQYAQLTDEDLVYTEGKGDELVGRLQDKLGKDKGEVTKILNDL
ncbi:CsbD family protein [Hymenobacter terrenus]|uniref:CsbD family protein n=1 Tax=Hymenobacter terrenus TaxID=1629124 RepID=UPI000907FD6E|nr:CsbD family protein [Hymenobacter terrenus]